MARRSVCLQLRVQMVSRGVERSKRERQEPSQRRNVGQVMSTLGFYQGLGIPSLSLKNMFLEGGEEEARKLEKTFDVKIIEKPF